MQKKIFSKLFFLFFIFFSSAFGEIIVGKPMIIDGDTIIIDKKKIRLHGIDAPEKKQICKKTYLHFFIFNFKKNYKCGEKSTSALLKKIKDKKIKCILKDDRDIYKRHIGTCYLKDQNINKWLVKNGYALAYEKYSKKYLFDEQYAKENKLGLWKGTFMKPEKWRRISN